MLGAILIVFGLLLFILGIFMNGAFTLLLAAMIGLTGLQLLALGVVGEYVWRALDESRRRPSYLIEISTDHPTLERTS